MGFGNIEVETVQPVGEVERAYVGVLVRKLQRCVCWRNSTDPCALQSMRSSIHFLFVYGKCELRRVVPHYTALLLRWTV